MNTLQLVAVENNMGLCRKTIWLLAVFMLSEACFALPKRSVTAPALKNQINSRLGTKPVSSYQNSLVRSPNPINDYGNRIVTGNVGGGKHFRGSVPYNAISDFGGRLGSGTLDNFLRRSTISSNYYTGGFTPYYSYTGTVTRIQPGTNMIVTAPSSRIRADASFAPTGLVNPQRRINPRKLPTSNLTPTGKIVFAPIGEEQISDFDITKQHLTLPLQQDTLKTKDYNLERQDFNKRLEDLKKETKQLQEQLQQEEPKDKEKATDETAEKTADYNQMLKEYQANKEVYDRLYPDEAQKENQQDSSMLKVKLGERKLKYKQAPKIDIEETQKAQKSAEPEKDLSESAIEARARVAEHDFDSFDSESNSRFDAYINSAKENMKKGKYYLAANDYSYATLYKPTDPIAFAGRSYALFAAGEYVSSAVNINKAIELSPDYANVKIDLISLIGNRDTIEKRLTDIDNWYGVTSSPELKFLQAYIYMQIDRLDKAAEAIRVAQKKMSDVPAVNTLAEAIKNRQK